jgi:acyl carrier protein
METEKIIQIVSDVLKTPVNAETSQENCYRWDSLQHLNIIVALEEKFDVYFEPDDISNMKSIKAIEAMLMKYMEF